MATRDPNKTARNRMRGTIKVQLRLLLPNVLIETGLSSESSLNATIGSKTDDFFDLKTDVIVSQDQFVGIWIDRLKKSALSGDGSHQFIWTQIQKNGFFKKYIILFLKRSYLTHYDKLAKNRPTPEEAELWIGQKNAAYGLLVTPRFREGQWENDKSEIRAFRYPYWTIGHVLKTGLVIPGKDERMMFNTAADYLKFFQEVIVRNSGSQYEYEIAGLYKAFVLSQDNPLLVPLLIPEYRYAGLKEKHEYRLDFMTIDPYTLDKTGFELSPWSSHGYLAKVKEMTQKAINELASDNFGKEMKKHRAYFKKHGVFCLIYTDENLKDIETLFNEEIVPRLTPEVPQTQLPFVVLEEFF